MEIDLDAEFQALSHRASAFGVIPRRILMDTSGDVRMAEMDYTPFSGEQAAAAYVTFSLCTQRVSALRRESACGRLDDVFRPGSVSVALPDDGAKVSWGRNRVIAIGIDHARQGDRLGIDTGLPKLQPIAARLHRDPLMTSLITALWHEGEINGLSGAFFDHGVARLFTRLRELGGEDVAPRSVKPLSTRQITAVTEFVHARLDGDIGVADMAALTGRDPSGFSRAFKQATGLAPFQFLTSERMARAEALLRQGQSVTAAAIMVGYANPSKFAAAFRRYRGQLPSAVIQ